MFITVKKEKVNDFDGIMNRFFLEMIASFFYIYKDCRVKVKYSYTFKHSSLEVK